MEHMEDPGGSSTPTQRRNLIMNDRPVWVGIAMKTADGRVVTWQMNEPLTIEISQEFSRNWHMDGPETRTQFRISGGAYVWREGAEAAPASYAQLAAPLKEIEGEQQGTVP
jgi:hypothetical protein